MHVLVVDDAATVRMYHRRILERAGFTVEEAGNGYEGLEAALRHPPGLLVADVNMPKLDGYSLVRGLRGHRETQAIPVILISTESSERERSMAVQCGANVFLVKPVPPEELVRRARALVGQPR